LKRGDWHEITPGAREASPSVSPLHQLEHALQKPVAFLIVPIFGYTNAGVSFTGVTAATLIEPLKDQRDQDQRRHEQQVQQVQAELRQQQLVLVMKQDEVTRLNQEGARLVLELSHTKQSLYEQLTQGRKLEQKIEQLQSLQQHTGDLERQLASKTAESGLLAERMKEVDAQLAPANARTRELELQLAEANAKALAHEQIGEQLRVYLDKIAAGPATAAAPKS
jgi:hypothetical protein